MAKLLKELYSWLKAASQETSPITLLHAVADALTKTEMIVQKAGPVSSWKPPLVALIASLARSYYELMQRCIIMKVPAHCSIELVTEENSGSILPAIETCPLTMLVNLLFDKRTQAGDYRLEVFIKVLSLSLDKEFQDQCPRHEVRSIY